jgi:hypothetical protein
MAGEQDIELYISLNADVDIRRFVQFCGSHVALSTRRLEGSGKAVPVLHIPRGDAKFGRGGILLMTFPGWERWRETVGIKGHHVLFIQHLEGERAVEKNWYYCEKCATCSGELLQHKPGSIQGTMSAEFSCHLCGRSWWRENI